MSDEKPSNHPYIRPKDAATLLILKRGQGGDIQLLMGKRHMRHSFMPGKFVFPGGGVDPADSRVKNVTSYHPEIESKLSKQLKNSKSPARVRALALSAIRETYEEAGLFIGKKVDRPNFQLGPGFEAFAQRKIQPDLSNLRLVGRAITPPGRVRRFDARFLAVWDTEIAEQLEDGKGPSGELEECAWLSFSEAHLKDLPIITKRILNDLEDRLLTDPDLSPLTSVPFYYFRGRDFVKDSL